MVPKALGPSAVLPSGLRAALEMRAGLRPRPAAHPPREGGAAPERAEGQRFPMDPAGLLGLKEWVSTRQRANHAGPRSGPEGALPHTHAHARMRTYPHARTHAHARTCRRAQDPNKQSESAPVPFNGTRFSLAQRPGAEMDQWPWPPWLGPQELSQAGQGCF